MLLEAKAALAVLGGRARLECYRSLAQRPHRRIFCIYSICSGFVKIGILSGSRIQIESTARSEIESRNRENPERD
ncbi:hypothetical protein EVAR_28467_1 [Eumeta japonica]|uniref:Uncharacterized protein n=1 Tax=Eumeta variegata TaxID=151549 RepID=A0A4C1V9C3_EUMVA|nr:hypothetical protein EVAR_28467_1 [Eumeta japonica]